MTRNELIQKIDDALVSLQSNTPLTLEIIEANDFALLSAKEYIVEEHARLLLHEKIIPKKEYTPKIRLLGEKIKEQRNKRGLTLEDIAAMSGQDSGFFHSLEDNSIDPTDISNGLFIDIAEMFGSSVYLIEVKGGTNYRTIQPLNEWEKDNVVDVIGFRLIGRHYT